MGERKTEILKFVSKACMTSSVLKVDDYNWLQDELQKYEDEIEKLEKRIKDLKRGLFMPEGKSASN